MMPNAPASASPPPTSQQSPVPSPRRFLPRIGSPAYHVMLACVAILILGPLGGISAAFMNFSIGFFIGGQVLAGILGSTVTLPYGPEGKHGANYMQTMAASVAGLCGMAVLVQAMVWLGLPEPPTWKLVLYLMSIGMFGAGVGMLYTPLLVDRMQLPYPSGFAVANILRALTDKKLLRRSVAKLGSGMLAGFAGGVASLKIASVEATALSMGTIGAGSGDDGLFSDPVPQKHPLAGSERDLPQDRIHHLARHHSRRGHPRHRGNPGSSRAPVPATRNTTSQDCGRLETRQRGATGFVGGFLGSDHGAGWQPGPAPASVFPGGGGWPFVFVHAGERYFAGHLGLEPAVQRICDDGFRSGRRRPAQPAGGFIERRHRLCRLQRWRGHAAGPLDGLAAVHQPHGAISLPGDWHCVGRPAYSGSGETFHERLPGATGGPIRRREGRGRRKMAVGHDAEVGRGAAGNNQSQTASDDGAMAGRQYRLIHRNHAQTDQKEAGLQAARGELARLAHGRFCTRRHLAGQPLRVILRWICGIQCGALVGGRRDRCVPMRDRASPVGLTR